MSNEEPDEESNVNFIEHLLIRDADTGEILMNQRPYYKEVKTHGIDDDEG